MNKRVFNTVIGLVAVMALLVGLSVHRILSPPAMTPEQLSENGFFLYEVPRRFQDFALVDHRDEAFSREDLEGKWSLIFFGFTYCPDICPTTMATLAQFDRLLGDTDYAEDTQVIMVSVDPRRDTPENLEQYINFFNEDFIGLTGEYLEIFNFARQLNVAFQYLPTPNGDYTVSHSGEIILLNPMGHFHGFFKQPHQPDRMLQNYRSVRQQF